MDPRNKCEDDNGGSHWRTAINKNPLSSMACSHRQWVHAGGSLDQGCTWSGSPLSPARRCALCLRLHQINALATGQHLDEGGKAFGASFRFLGVLQAVEYGVTLAAGEAVEAHLRLFVLLQGGDEISRHLDRTLRGISGVPAAIFLGQFDLFQSGACHATGGDQGFDLGAVFLRPFAFLLARGEAHQPVLIIEFVELTVDPAMAQGGLHRRRLADAGDARTLLGQLQPDAAGAGAFGCQPLVEGRLTGKGEDGKVAAVSRHFTNPAQGSAQTACSRRDGQYGCSRSSVALSSSPLKYFCRAALKIGSAPAACENRVRQERNLTASMEPKISSAERLSMARTRRQHCTSRGPRIGCAR